MTIVQELAVTEDLTVRDALERLDANAIGILLLIDLDGRFRRTITDGDLRRYLLGGAELGTPISKLPPIEACTVRESDPAEIAFDLMRKHGLRHVPVLDELGKAVDLRLRTEYEQPILLSIPHMSELEQEYVARAFDSNWVAPLGPNVDGFEREMAAYLEVDHAAALVSGTAALHLALINFDVGPGDIVFCSSLTFVASANPIVYQGGTPVFVDSAPGSWNMSASSLELAFDEIRRQKKMPKAVIVVNLYGHSADYDRLQEICGHFDVPIIEDAAESLGATYKGRKSGSFGEMATLSFNGNKIITTSGGGMLVSNNAPDIEKARWLSTQAKDEANYYLHSVVGYNYRLSNILAGIGRGQLKVLPDRVAARRSVYSNYRSGLGDLDQIEWIDELPESRATHWLSVILLRHGSNLTPDTLIARLASYGVEARRVWNPMHRQPLFASADYYSAENGSVSDDLFERGVCLPSSSSLSDEEQAKIISVIRKIVTAAR